MTCFDTSSFNAFFENVKDGVYVDTKRNKPDSAGRNTTDVKGSNATDVVIGRNDFQSSPFSHNIYEDNETKENWLVYFKGKTRGDFSDWLERHKPSEITRKRDNVDWICVSKPRESRDDLDQRVAAMVEAWEDIEISGIKPTSDKTVEDLAKHFNVTSGKWIFFPHCGGKADHLWSVVAKGIMSDRLTCDLAKVSALEDSDQHCISMHNADYTDMDQVMAAERSIREIGIKCKMQYKPDAFTYLNIYAGNVWGIKPYIFKSYYDLNKGYSIVREDFYF